MFTTIQLLNVFFVPILFQHDNSFLGRKVTALHCAAWKNSVEVVNALLQAGADVNLQTDVSFFFAFSI